VLEALRRHDDGDVVRIQAGGTTLVATGGHPFWVESGEGLEQRPAGVESGDGGGGQAVRGRWVDARDLRVGDRLISRSAGAVAIDSLSVEERELPTFNLHVPETHSYTVGSLGLWVHNASKPCKKRKTGGGKPRKRRGKNGQKIAPTAVRNPAWRQSPAASGVLGERLGIQPGSGQAAHHIVPGTHSRAAPARAILDTYQIDINAAENGVSLVGGRGAPQNVMPRHHRGSGLHTHEGTDAVTDRLRAATNGVTDWATGRQRVLDTLADIRAEILAGTFP